MSTKAIAALLCPFVLAAFPLVSLFAANQTGVEVTLLWWPLALCLGGAVGVVALAWLTTRDPVRAGVVASVVLGTFLYFGLLPWSERNWYLVVWLAVAVALVGILLRVRQLPSGVPIVLLAAGLVMLLPQVASIVLYHGRNPAPSAADPRLWPTVLEGTNKPAGRLPDIYVLMPDDYARADVLETYFGYDDGAFLGELRRRGFVVSDQARSPYSYSEMNMASLLNLDYLSRFPPVVGASSQDMRPVKRVLEDNRASRLLRGLGYDYVHLDTDEVTFAGRNERISPVATPDSFMTLWLQQTLLRRVGGPVGFDDAAVDARFRASIRSGFAELNAVRPGPRPKFVVFHTLLPHDPYIFGARGQAVTFPPAADHTGEEGMAYYVQQLEFVQQQLLHAIDTIQAHAETPPVIVLQADEGFEVDESVVGEAAARDIRVKGLSALSLPGVANPQPPHPPNIVNDLRYVFNAYLGTHYAMLDTVSYPERGDQIYDYREELRVE